MKQTTQTWRVKYLLNDCEPGAVVIAAQMRAAGVRFTTSPTSGPATILVDGFASYGLRDVRHWADKLIGYAQSGEWPAPYR